MGSPNPDSAEIPVRVVVLLESIVGAPSEEVSESPVRGTPISVVMDPTEAVADIPVRAKETSDLPTGVPTEAAKEIPVKLATVSWVVVGVPKVEADEIPVTGTVSADSPQFSKPHVSLPHPISLKAVTLPTDEVADMPVNVRVTSACFPQVF